MKHGFPPLIFSSAIVVLSRLAALFRLKRPRATAEITSIPTVTFDSRRVTALVRDDILSALKASGDIPRSRLPAINKVAVASVERGRDIAMLHSAIMSIGIDGMTKRRAAEIAMHLHNRAISIMDVQKMADLGIEEAVWMYSGAPCYPNDRPPSSEELILDAAHKAANGQRYRVRDGMSLAGKRTWPGREVGCKCVSRAVVKGVS